MNAKDLIRIGRKLYGSRGWITALASVLKVDVSTIRRWVAADHVPGPASVALRYMDQEHRMRGVEQPK